VAALYDIHGNVPALEAVLEEVRRARVDLVVIGGDVLPGPMSAAALTVLSGLDVPVECIHGNGEGIVLAQADGKDISEVPEPYRDVIRWDAERMLEQHRVWLSTWPLTCRIEVRGIGDVLFCHATPRHDNEGFTRLTPEDRVAPMFAGVNAALVVCGHTHMQFDRMVGGTRVVNAGSIGMPFSRPQGAYWLLLGGPHAVDFRRTDYDFEGAAGRVRATGFPMVEQLCVRYILSPPTEAETLTMYSALN